MHWQFPRNLDEELLDNEQLYRWLKFGDIKGEIVSTIVAAQDQAVSKNCFKNEPPSRKKLTVNTCCVNNMKKLLTT